MGHKVNPDVFRLGVTKSWSFQLRTNKNFIKNLFLFKFLRNLFMNYTIPNFNFDRRRNQKIGDKLVFRGEEQIVSSPFVKNNILFSHVYFGAIKNKMFIESFFIDVAFKQERKRIEGAKKSPFRDYVEYKPWNSFFYKPSIINVHRRQNQFVQNKLKKIFTNRMFRFFAKKSRVFKKKPIKRLSKDFFSFFKKYAPRYQKKLKKFFDIKFKVKRRRKKLIIARSFERRSVTFFRLLSQKRPLNKFLRKRFNKFEKNYKFVLNTFYFRRKINRFVKRSSGLLGIRHFKPKYNKNFDVIIKYKKRFETVKYKKVTLPKMLFLSSKSFFTSNEAIVLKKSFPKNPLYFLDFVHERNLNFSKIYRNLKTLKYFVRLLKHVRFFSIKKKIFFTQNLISLIMSFFSLSSATTIVKKTYVLLQSLVFSTFCYSFCNFLNFKKKFFVRYCFFKGVSKTAFRSVKDITGFSKLTFSVVGQNKFKFNSSLILNYILIKLGQYFNIHEIINPLSFYMKGLNSISGYRILVTGRLTRKERAAVLVRSGKRMPLSTIKANVDYSAGFKIMKFGLVGIKVYLFLNSSSLINLYRFQFSYNAETAK